MTMMTSPWLQLCPQCRQLLYGGVLATQAALVNGGRYGAEDPKKMMVPFILTGIAVVILLIILSVFLWKQYKHKILNCVCIKQITSKHKVMKCFHIEEKPPVYHPYKPPPGGAGGPTPGRATSMEIKHFVIGRQDSTASTCSDNGEQGTQLSLVADKCTKCESSKVVMDVV